MSSVQELREQRTAQALAVIQTGLQWAAAHGALLDLSFIWFDRVTMRPSLSFGDLDRMRKHLAGCVVTVTHELGSRRYSLVKDGVQFDCLLLTRGDDQRHGVSQEVL